MTNISKQLGYFLIFFSTPLLAINHKALNNFADISQISLPVSAAMLSMIKNDKQGTLELIEGTAYTAALTYTLKKTITAPRPNQADNNSFPSGHSSITAQSATYLQLRYGWHYGLPAYALTTAVAYSRIETKQHYWRDVIGGAALGMGIQYMVSKLGFSATKLFISPYATSKSKGITTTLSGLPE